MVTIIHKQENYLLADRGVLFFLCMLTLSLVSGCSVPASKYSFHMPVLTSTSSQMVWPSPPDVPRYSYIGDIRGQSIGPSANGSDSWLSRFFAAVVGLDQETGPVVDLLRPQQVVVDAAGRIYVADAGRQSVFVFDEKAGEFFLWNESSLNIPFLSPIGVAIVKKNVLVTDSEQSQIFRLSLAGVLIDSIGKGVLKRPTGIAYDAEGERIFVADTGDDNIKVFDIQGGLIEVLGSTGVREGEFNRPTFLAYKDGLLYVADSLNARIQVLGDLGNSVHVIGQRGLYIGNFSRPKGIATDSDGNIYVAESYYDYVLIYNAQGELLMSLGGSGNQPGKFSQPTGIWIDDKDRIFISDMLNGRVSVYQYLGDN